mgnify:CR=1 FL=1
MISLFRRREIVCPTGRPQLGRLGAAQQGRESPIVPESDRALMLAGLKPVDYVVVFDEDEPRELIGEILPDVLVKGREILA